MSAQSTTYSFKDLTGSIAFPLGIGTLLIGGQLGVGQIVFTNAAEHTSHDRAADGTIMPSFMAGDDGNIQIEVQQTSIAHKVLLSWLNTLKTAAMNDDVSNWATTTAFFRSLTDGSVHQASGISPMKVPDKTYAANGGKITWNLPCCSLINL
jgi:hypothetical protein